LRQLNAQHRGKEIFGSFSVALFYEQKQASRHVAQPIVCNSTANSAGMTGACEANDVGFEICESHLSEFLVESRTPSDHNGQFCALLNWLEEHVDQKCKPNRKSLSTEK